MTKSIFLLSAGLLVFATSLLSQEHYKVQYETGKYAGWPANWGMWNWGNEILVGYSYADFKDKEHGHTYDPKTSLSKFSRSLDGGKTWKMEDAYAAGITDTTWEHQIKDKAVNPKRLTDKINFLHDNFALTFRMRGELFGGTSFYYTYDRGKHWEGPFDLSVEFTGPKPTGIVSRTDYIIDGKNDATAFITVGFGNKDSNWRQVACIRTTDGGITWKQMSWIGPSGINSIMPASIRLSPNKILTIIRRTKPAAMVSFLSEDNGKSWKQLNDPVKVDANGNPPALVKLKSGTLCLVYGIREASTMDMGIGMYVSYSTDQGLSWSRPELLKGKDGACWDIGYPRAILRPDGKVVAAYYYNNANWGDKFRYIAATIFDPTAPKP